jgi:Skp family chaperone for outer membrane proteins
MTAQRKPTLADLETKLDGIAKEFRGMRSDVDTLQQWKLAEDAYKAALKQVHTEQSETGSDRFLNKELLKALGLALTAIVSLVALIQASK